MPYELVPTDELDNWLQKAHDKEAQAFYNKLNESQQHILEMESKSRFYAAKLAGATDEELQRPFGELYDEIKRGTDKGKELEQKIEINMPAMNLSALEPLGLLPGIFSYLAEVISNLFTFDIDEYNQTLELIGKAKGITEIPKEGES